MRLRWAPCWLMNWHILFYISPIGASICLNWRGRFSNDFGSSHLTGMQGWSRSGQLQTNRLDQVGALPLGSRIGVNPWSDQIELLKSKPVQLESSAEKMPFEVTPFFFHLK